MSQKSRFFLFFILLILFLAIAPATVLYSWGFRFDFETKKITQTGGFYFKVWPKNAQIYFDGKPVKKTDFFFGAAYIDNLLPKRYEVEIKKQGFHSWKKTLTVKEKQVTEAKNIILVSQNPAFEILSKNVEEFFVSPDQKKIVLKEVGEKEWSLKLLELDKNIKSHLAKESEFGGFSLTEFVDSFFGIQKPETEEKEGKLSPDQRKLASLSNSEVWVLFLKEELGHLPDERLLVARFSEKVDNLFWMNDHYLVFTVGGKIKIAEIDDRDRINIVEFAEFKSPKIFFNQTDKKLYILSQGNFLVSEKLLP